MSGVLCYCYADAAMLKFEILFNKLKTINSVDLRKIKRMDTKDCNGNTLNNGDVVIVNKTLDVKGSPIVIKKGTKVKNIRLTDDPNEVDCKVNGTRLVLKTMFLKKK
tara:strand:- start:738 stop:1058 length:321 start_codon:yes stop_codon:yes gene_type:complete